MQRKTTKQATRTNKLLLLTIFNHASWSTLHVAARYLQVYAKPITFDSQTLLSSCKGSAAIFLYLIGIINSGCADDINSDLSSADTVRGTAGGTACLVDGDDDEDDDPDSSDGSNDTDESVILKNDNMQSTYQQQSSLLSVTSSQQNHDRNLNSEAEQMIDSELQRQKIKYTLLFAFVSTTRASSNIASSKYTYPYNISEFHIGLIILLMRLLDVYLYSRLFLTSS